MNPLPHIAMFNNYLQSRGVDLLFIAVPNKEEVYFDKFDTTIAAPAVSIVNPYGRKFLYSLQQAGVEVIDLLPLFLHAKLEDTTGGEYLYQKQDTHWSSKGLQIAAQTIGDRIKTYPWYDSYKDTIGYTFSDTIVERRGDLVERLPQNMQTAYVSQSMQARRIVLPDGTGYQGNQPASPILLIGDSFTGVFELIDCKSAGVGAHIAAQCRIPVDIVTSWGGGPMVRQKMLRTRGNRLDHKKVIIYIMVARDLYNYTNGWELLRSSTLE
jgi:alginate O-acetyltransferase complex protein AlgJ